MSDDCFINENCFRPKLSGKKNDPLLNVPTRPYLDLEKITTTTTTTTTTINPSYDPGLLQTIVIPSGKPCPISFVTTTTTTTTTVNANYAIGGLKGQFNLTNDSLSTISDGNIGLTIPLTNPIIFMNINYNNVGEYYSFIAYGYFRPPINGQYTFFTSSDDGSAIWLGEVARIDEGRNISNALLNNNITGTQGDTKRSASIILNANTFYPIRIVHRSGCCGNNLTFSWSGPGIAETSDLKEYFFYDN